MSLVGVLRTDTMRITGHCDATPRQDWDRRAKKGRVLQVPRSRIRPECPWTGTARDEAWISSSSGGHTRKKSTLRYQSWCIQLFFAKPYRGPRLTPIWSSISSISEGCRRELHKGTKFGVSFWDWESFSYRSCFNIRDPREYHDFHR